MSIKKNIEDASMNAVLEKEQGIIRPSDIVDNTDIIQIGYLPLDLSSLPSKGIFYPPETKILIKAASVAEIRHWSMIGDDVMKIDDALNHILEKCSIMKNSSMHLSWKDLLEVDRFYVILAIRELTFKSENPLKVSLENGDKIPVTKDMIEFINLDPKLERFFDRNELCFVFDQVAGKELRLSLPTVGLSMWLKKYVSDKVNRNENYDEVFASSIPFLNIEWRYLNNKVYESMCDDSYNWSLNEISIISSFKDKFISSISPEVVYKYNDSGVEARVPLDFHGGYKSLFIIPDILDIFD